MNSKSKTSMGVSGLGSKDRVWIIGVTSTSVAHMYVRVLVAQGAGTPAGEAA